MPVLKCVCGAKYNVPDEWAGKRVKCKKCGAHFTIPAKPAAEPEPEDEFRLAPVEEQEARISSMAAASASTRAGSTVTTPAMSEPDENGWISVGDKGASTSFWGDVGRAFVFFVDPNNLITYLFLCLVSSLTVLLLIAPFAGLYGICLRLFLFLAIVGWVFSFYFNTIVEAASGERRLPDLGFSDGLYEETIAPFFKFLATWAISMAPAVAYVLTFGGTMNPRSMDEADWVPLGLFVLGVFLWPFIILIVALGGIDAVTRPHLIIKSVVKSFVPYVCTCILVGIAMVGTLVLTFLLLRSKTELGNHPIILGMILHIPLQYAWIVAMMLIGGYYHHYKHKFAWSWG